MWSPACTTQIGTDLVEPSGRRKPMRISSTSTRCCNASAVIVPPPTTRLNRRSGARQAVEQQIKNLVLWTQRGQESDLSPDSRSGDGGPKLRPHCDQATRDAQGRMPESDRRVGR